MTQIIDRTDHQIRTAVTDELAWAPNVTADNVGVSVTDGAVTLSGEVEDYLSKTSAVRAALRVPGVVAVADEIVVKYSWGPRADADIVREAGTALKGSVFAHDAVKATVHEGRVSLSGAVAWNYQRETAERLVAGLSGVTSVANHITLMPTLPFAATEARSKITAALLRTAQRDAGNVHIAVEGNEIELTGTVTSWTEVRQAGNAAWATPGVTHVRNHLRVRG